MSFSDSRPIPIYIYTFRVKQENGIGHITPEIFYKRVSAPHIILSRNVLKKL